MSSLTPIEKIMADVLSGKVSQQEGSAMIQELLDNKKTCTYKVSAKGGIQFDGIRNRFPIVLYRSELETIMSMVDTDEFKAFLADNATKLSTKVPKE
jgi:polyhydroxyalkanoate synthesis regulator phasin